MSSSNQIPPEDLNFHYSRSERTGSLSDEAHRQLYEPRKKLTINKRHMIVIIDILLVVIAFVSVNAYRSSLGTARNVAGCDLELSGFIYDQRALVSLKIQVKDPGKIPDGVTVRFSLNGREREVTDILPGTSDGIRILRAEFPMEGEEKGRITAEVTLGESSKRLEKALKSE